jgi:hypothetical protein
VVKIVSCYSVIFVIPQHILIVLAWEEKYLKEIGTVEDVDLLARDHRIPEALLIAVLHS